MDLCNQKRNREVELLGGITSQTGSLLTSSRCWALLTMPFVGLLHVVFCPHEFHVVSHVGLEVMQVVGMNCPMASLPTWRKRGVRRRAVEVGRRMTIEPLKFLSGSKTCGVYLSLNWLKTKFDHPFPGPLKILQNDRYRSRQKSSKWAARIDTNQQVFEKISKMLDTLQTGLWGEWWARY